MKLKQKRRRDNKKGKEERISFSSDRILWQVWLNWSNVHGQLNGKVWKLGLSRTMHSIWVAGDLKFDQLNMRVNCLHQLLHAFSFFILSIGGVVNWRRWLRVRNLVEVFERGVFEHSHGQQCCHPPFAKPVLLRLEHDRLG